LQLSSDTTVSTGGGIVEMCCRDIGHTDNTNVVREPGLIRAKDKLARSSREGNGRYGLCTLKRCRQSIRSGNNLAANFSRRVVFRVDVDVKIAR
jgi:hypothetical protein